VRAFREAEVGVPVVVRLAGTNVDEGRRIIQQSGLPLVVADTLADAAAKAVAAIRAEAA
jgi:malate-CoA ligase subunit beta